MVDSISSPHHWEHDPASQAQLKLIASRQIVPREQLKGLTKGQACNIIRDWKANYKAATTEELASDAQINYIKKLCSDLNLAAGPYFTDDNGRITKRKAIGVITDLRSRLEAPVETKEGLYKVGTNIYKVKTDRWGHLVCQKMVRLDMPEEVSNGVRTHKFVVEKNMLRSLANVPPLTMEEAKEFAAETSACIRCGMQLEPTITNPDGSPRWIGPICQTKMGW